MGDDESLDTLVELHLAREEVPTAEFLFVVDEILRVLQWPRDRMDHIYHRIADDTKGNSVLKPDVVRQYHTGQEFTVPANIYRGAVKTLRWACRTNGEEPSSRVVRFLANLSYVKKSKEAEPEENEPEQTAPDPKPEQKPKRKPKKRTERKEKKPAKQKKAPKNPQKTYATFDDLKELVDRLLSCGAYPDIQSIEQDMVARSVCRQGAITGPYLKGQQIKYDLYSNLEGLAMLHNVHKKKKKLMIYRGETVPRYAFDGILFRALEIYEDKDENERKYHLRKAQDQMHGLGLCEEDELISTDKSKKKEIPTRLFDNLVILIRRKDLSEEYMGRLRTEQEFDQRRDYEVGQLLSFDRGRGVVIDRETDMIRVYMDETEEFRMKMVSNPLMLRTNLHIDPAGNKGQNTDPYTGL